MTMLLRRTLLYRYDDWPCSVSTLEPLPWPLLPEPPGLTVSESAMRDLDKAMQLVTVAGIGWDGEAST